MSNKAALFDLTPSEEALKEFPWPYKPVITELHIRYLAALVIGWLSNGQQPITRQRWVGWAAALGVRTHRGRTPRSISQAMIEWFKAYQLIKVGPHNVVQPTERALQVFGMELSPKGRG